MDYPPTGSLDETEKVEPSGSTLIVDDNYISETRLPSRSGIVKKENKSTLMKYSLTDSAEGHPTCGVLRRKSGERRKPAA